MSYTADELRDAINAAREELWEWSSGNRSTWNSHLEATADNRDHTVFTEISRHDLVELRIAREKLESLILLAQIGVPHVKPDVSGLVPNEAHVNIQGSEDEGVQDCHEPSCSYQEPHRHGFACDKACAICGGF